MQFTDQYASEMKWIAGAHFTLYLGHYYRPDDYCLLYYFRHSAPDGWMNYCLIGCRKRGFWATTLWKIYWPCLLVCFLLICKALAFESITNFTYGREACAKHDGILFVCSVPDEVWMYSNLNVLFQHVEIVEWLGDLDIFL